MVILDELRANLGYAHDIGLVFFGLLRRKGDFAQKMPVLGCLSKNSVIRHRFNRYFCDAFNKIIV